MKKEYVKPAMESEVFISNEYVAACYSGKCDVDCWLYYRWYDIDEDGKVDSERELGNWVNLGNEACDAEFNEKGSISPVAWYDGSEWRTGDYFVAETPKNGYLSTHVSSSTTKTNASQ